jgi:metallophosphoesterase superfamily enzyme
VEDDFLVDGISIGDNIVHSGPTSGDIFFPYFSDRNCIVRPTFNKYSEATPVNTSKAIFDVPGRSIRIDGKGNGVNKTSTLETSML